MLAACENHLVEAHELLLVASGFSRESSPEELLPEGGSHESGLGKSREQVFGAARGMNHRLRTLRSV